MHFYTCTPNIKSQTKQFGAVLHFVVVVSKNSSIALVSVSSQLKKRYGKNYFLTEMTELS